MIDLTPIITAVIAIIVALITYRLVPWIKARTNETQQNILFSITKILVEAAEQLYGAGNGRTKLEYVIAGLEERGFTVDLDVIEGMVRELSMNNGEATSEDEDSEEMISNDGE